MYAIKCLDYLNGISVLLYSETNETKSKDLFINNSTEIDFYIISCNDLDFRNNSYLLVKSIPCSGLFGENVQTC